MEMLEIAALAAAAIVVAIATGIAGRRRGQFGYWAWSWAVLIAGGALLQLGGDLDWTPARAAGAFCTVLFPGLQLAGAMEHVGRHVPRWLIPAFGSVALVRLATALAGFEAQSHMAILVFELAAFSTAGVLIYRWSAARGRSAMEWLLMAGFGLVGIVEAADAVLDITSGPPGVSWIVWLAVGFPVGFWQVLASFDLMRRRVAESLGERETALQDLKESNERLHAIANYAHDLIVEADSQRRIQYANPRFHELLGYTPEEVLGHDLRDFAWDTSQFPSRADLMGGRNLISALVMLRHRDGSPRWVESSARVYRRAGEPRIVIIARDVTERLRVDDQTRKAQKLESLGVLSGGIAHDFNNLLTGILGNADLALAKLAQGDPARVREFVSQVVSSAEHAAELTQQLQAYSGGSPFEIRAIDVNEELRSRAELLRTAIGDSVKLELELADGLPAAEADPAHLIQAVLNLAINGAEACGDGPGPVRVTTGLVQMEEPLPIPASGTLEQGPYVFVEVRDAGHGIDESMRERVFDPFFTTKATGRGLGLAMVHGVVQTLRGAILVDSTPNKGTCIRMLLRVSTGQAAAEAAPSPGDLRGSARILVVDDDPAVLQVVCSVLGSSGYEVRTADTGMRAAEIMAEQGSEIALILLDAVMPGERAELVLDALRAEHPHVPVLLISGYAEAEATRRFSATGELAGFLPKPFRAEGLVSAVRDALA